MNQEVNFTLSLLAVSLVQQNQMLKQQNAMLRDLMDHVDAVGDRLWRMDRRLTTPPVDQAGTRKRAAKKRRLAPKPPGKKGQPDEAIGALAPVYPHDADA